MTTSRVQNVLITGASGFIGTRLAECFTNPLLFSRSQPKAKGTWIQGDLTDTNTVFDACRHHPDYIIHLGAKVHASNAKETAHLFATNVLGTSTLLTACTTYNPKHIILVSTALEYGNIPGPWSEEMSCKPENAYGLSKWLATQQALWFAKHHATPVTILRLSVVYGKGSNSRIVNAILEAEKNHSALHTTLGEQTRDFVYVDDVIRAIQMILGNPETHGEIFNVGCGKSISIHHMTLLFRDILGNKSTIITNKPYSEGEVMTYEVNTQKIISLGWTPQVSLERGLTETARGAQ